MSKLKVVLILLITLFPLTASVVSKADEDTVIRIKGGKEVRVLRDIDEGLHYSNIRWCGNSSFLIYGGEAGIRWTDLNGKSVIISTSDEDSPAGCTPDGRWVLYIDRNSSREYKGKPGWKPENIVGLGPRWYGFVSDLYRYEVSTGRRQKIAAVRDGNLGLVSPDGSKVLLGNRYDSTLEMPEPKWEAVWLANEWRGASTYWFPDSSGVVANIWDDGYSLVVEFFGVEGWSKEFSLDLMRTRRDGEATGVFLEAVDEDNILHFIAIDYFPGVGSSRNKYNSFRCKIERKDLICSLMGGFEEEEGKHIKVYDSFVLLSNHDMVFMYKEGKCIRHLKFRETVAVCMAGTRLEDDRYAYIDTVGVSPDGRRLASRRRSKYLRRPNGRLDEYRYDLVVIELEKD